MYPLLSLRSLTTNVKHSIREVTDDKSGLGDTSGFDTRSQDILIVGEVIVSGDSVNRVKVAERC